MIPLYSKVTFVRGRHHFFNYHLHDFRALDNVSFMNVYSDSQDRFVILYLFFT